MPTTRNRYPITATDDVVDALDAASAKWPEDAGNPTKLLNRLIQRGRASLEDERDSAKAQRVAAVERGAGALSGVFGPDALAELREDWPQ